MRQPNDSTYRRAVRQLQTFLYTASQVDPRIPSVNPDGIYGKTTAEAVAAFQRLEALPDDRRVDFATWQKMREVFAVYRADGEDAAGLYPFTDAHGAVRPGEKSSLVLILQIMLESVRIFFGERGEIPLNGVYDKATEDAIRAFQRANLLDVTGVTDKKTWNRLAEAYNFAERERQ